MSVRRALVLAIGLTAATVSGDAFAAAAAAPPKIGKPRPPPPTPPDVPPLPPAHYDPTLSVGGEEVKARKIETRLSVDVQVNGRGPYKFIVDSGADTSAVGLRIARNLELPLTTPAILNGMTARHVVDRVKVDQLTVGPSTIRNLELPALKELDLGGDGMLGIDALVHQRLMMDFENKLIKVEDARVPEKFLPGAIIITARRQRGQLILTHVKAAGLPLDAIIDTGTEITIGNIALRDKLMRGANRRKFMTVKVTGVTGVTIEVQLAKVGELQLGPVTLRDVPMAFADVPPFKMFGLHNEPALMLGTDILETFQKVSLDFRARKVRFQLRKCNASVTIATIPENITRLSSNAVEVCRT